MQRRLAAQGIRPINNIVDITNYVMEEYGQPMHAYDLGYHRRAKRLLYAVPENGELFVTLDGQERTLDENVLMICDGRKSNRYCRYHGWRELHDYRQCKDHAF